MVTRCKRIVVARAKKYVLTFLSLQCFRKRLFVYLKETSCQKMHGIISHLLSHALNLKPRNATAAGGGYTRKTIIPRTPVKKFTVAEIPSAAWRIFTQVRHPLDGRKVQGQVSSGARGTRRFEVVLQPREKYLGLRMSRELVLQSSIFHPATLRGMWAFTMLIIFMKTHYKTETNITEQ